MDLAIDCAAATFAYDDANPVCDAVDLSLARGAFGVSARAGLDDDSGSSSRRTSILARAATMAAREACMTRAP